MKRITALELLRARRSTNAQRNHEQKRRNLHAAAALSPRAKIATGSHLTAVSFGPGEDGLRNATSPALPVSKSPG